MPKSYSKGALASSLVGAPPTLSGRKRTRAETSGVVASTDALSAAFAHAPSAAARVELTWAPRGGGEAAAARRPRAVAWTRAPGRYSLPLELPRARARASHSLCLDVWTAGEGSGHETRDTTVSDDGRRGVVLVR